MAGTNDPGCPKSGHLTAVPRAEGVPLLEFNRAMPRINPGGCLTLGHGLTRTRQLDPLAFTLLSSPWRDERFTRISAMKTCISCGRKNLDEADCCHECGASKFVLPSSPVDPLNRVGTAFARFLDHLEPPPARRQSPAARAMAVDPLHRVGPGFERFLETLAEGNQQNPDPGTSKVPEDSEAA